MYLFLPDFNELLGLYTFISLVAWLLITFPEMNLQTRKYTKLSKTEPDCRRF